MEKCMKDFARPTVVVSECLGFAPVRYNSRVIPDAFVSSLGKYVDYVTVCPEVGIGLGVPRKPVRIVSWKGGDRRLIQPETGLDFTQDMLDFSERFLSSLGEVDGFIMKRGSPSSGIKEVKIYPSTEKVAAIARGAGLFGGQVLLRFPELAVEDEGRLTNFNIRETFLTRVFAHAALRRVLKTVRMKDLVDFHASNKLLLMAYSQKELRILGRLVANPENREPQKLASDYERHFNLALASTPRRTSNINVLMHSLGYFKRELGVKEKSHFLDMLDLYRKGTVPLVAPSMLLKSWAFKYESDYLLSQSFFRPFPEGLVSERDSGKKIEP
jgi:uncharacterized protein YbgA (DUF1722 family)/uncharacterized protein YbbK (DUF523 family)